MSWTMVGSATVIAVALATGAYVWSHSSETTITPMERDVKVVRSTGSHEAHDVQRLDPASNVPAANRPKIEDAQTGVPIIPDDAELQAALPDPAFEPRALYARVRKEQRDAEWAGRSEQSIKAAMAPVPYITRDNLRIHCASTLCEIRGTMPNDLSIDNAGVGMNALQGENLNNSLAKAGLRTVMTSFSGSKDTQIFTIYASRR